MARREYQAGRPTTLTGNGLNATDLTFTIDEAFNWPDGTGGTLKFWVTIDPGTAQEERVLCTNTSGLTVTIDAAGRGVDGTGARTHAFGAVVWPSWSATDADESNAHIESAGFSDFSRTIHGLGSGDGAVVGTTKSQTLTLKTLTSPKINDSVAVTASSTELNVLDGITASTAELNHTDGVTSAIQTQLNTLTSSIASLITVPTGVISPYAGLNNNIPAGYFLCDGQAVSRSTFATLFGLVGSTYGAGDGTTTFNVPNLKGRVPVGLDATQVEFDLLGETDGFKTHTLTIPQMPSHSHSGQIVFGSGSGNSGVLIQGIGNNQPGTGSTGGDQAHNNLQPYIVVNYIIKT